MTNKIISIAAALMMGFTFSSFAGTPKGETKTEATEAKTESPSEGKTEANSNNFQYHVLFVENVGGTNYYRVESSDLADCDDEGTNACLITSPTQADANNRVPVSSATINQTRP